MQTSCVCIRARAVNGSAGRFLFYGLIVIIADLWGVGKRMFALIILETYNSKSPLITTFLQLAQANESNEERSPGVNCTPQTRNASPAIGTGRDGPSSSIKRLAIDLVLTPRRGPLIRARIL